MSVFSILGTGASGLYSSQFAANVAGNNATNVDTPGYTRRSALIQSQSSSAGGNGSRAVGTQRSIDGLVERRVLGARASLGQATAKQSSVAVLDAIILDVGGTLGSSIDDLEAAVAELGANPNETGARMALLNKIDGLSRAFNMAASSLADARTDVNDRIKLEVASANKKLTQIAELNKQIARASIDSGGSDDLRDQRDELVRSLSETLPVKTIEDSVGRVSVLLNGGQMLVSTEGSVAELQVSYDAVGDVSVLVPQAGLMTDVTSQITAGSIGGLISGRDDVIGATQSQLDQLAFDIATAYNTVHAAGYGLDGSTGLNLFDPPTGVAGAAAALRISTDVLGQPEKVAAATDLSTLPGDNRGALAMQALANANIGTGGLDTANGSLARIISFVSNSISASNTQVDQASAISAQMDVVRDSVSGVSLDEEMVSMMKFQSAYQASLKVIQAADEMMQDLLNMKR